MGRDTLINKISIAEKMLEHHEQMKKVDVLNVPDSAAGRKQYEKLHTIALGFYYRNAAYMYTSCCICTKESVYYTDYFYHHGDLIDDSAAVAEVLIQMKKEKQKREQKKKID